MDGMKVTIVDAAPEPEREQISVGDLTRQCNEAASKMSLFNPHRVLMLNCAYALQQLVERLAFYEKGSVQ